jgi:acyl-CoA synthetase (NDP forming)
LEASGEIGFPLVLKVMSEQIIHKTDVGGIVTGIKDVGQLRSELDAMESRIKPKYKDFGYLLQKQVSGTEIIIGMKRDSQFGPVILFGLGGVFTELFKDVAMRIAPLTKEDVSAMMQEVKSYSLLTGYRGSRPLFVDGLALILRSISELAVHEKCINEIDFNPVIVNESEALVVDARFI